jgi:transposase
MTAYKQALHASARETPRLPHARRAYRQQIAALDRRRVQGVDASEVHLALPRRYGRAPAGGRGLGSVLQNYGSNVTMRGALGVHGLHAVMTVDGATDADVCRTAVKPVLGPTLPPGDRGVRDHWQAHNAVGVQQAMARRGARLRYVPPYSPELSPIEPCWSKLNTALRQAQAHAGGARRRDCGGSRDRQSHRCLGLVQALRRSLTVMCNLL